MARGVSLEQMLTKLRAEVGDADNLALTDSVRNSYIYFLQTAQEMLWMEYAWSFLKVERNIQVQAGLRYYDLPPDIVFERIESVEFKFGNQWARLEFGIGAAQYNIQDSDRDFRSNPILRYDAGENNQIELWPVPNQNSLPDGYGQLRIQGIRNLNPLISNSDTCDLDDLLLVYCAAAQILMERSRFSQATMVKNKYTKRFKFLKAQNNKSSSFMIGSGGDGATWRPYFPELVTPIYAPENND